ncbi:MAG TPA: efflux RND transporter periplasmic adaptor subunit [Rhodocyclaceae bacterium]|nr:efflux RND transporter periplasmic adaptor subunit [Rhodocyclaceae bacterium]
MNISIFACRLPLAGVFLLLLAACGAGGGDTPGPAKAAAGGAPPPPEVEVIIVSRNDVSRAVELPGRAQAIRTAQVRARVEGIVEARLFQEGTDVRAGQPLFRLDGRVLAANVESARAQLNKAQAEATNAEQSLQRFQSLAAQKMASGQQIDQAVARQRQALADVGVAKAALARSEIDLSYATVTAPIGGRIGRALVTEGALVGKGEATHLATIEQLDPIWINFSQSSADYLRLREAFAGGKAKPARDRAIRLLLENGNEYALPGKLLFSDLSIDPSNGSVGMRAEFPNPQRLILPGQFVNLRLPVAEAEGAITVPQRAVQASPQGQTVMTVGPDNKVTPKAVKTGGLSGNDWIIAEGLNGGEQVIVNGLQKARPGSPVTPVPLAAVAKTGTTTNPPAGQ